MSDPVFFAAPATLTLGAVVTLTGAEPLGAVDLDRPITGVAPLDLAGPNDVSFFDSSRYLDDFRSTAAGACFTKKVHADKAPAGLALLITNHPYPALVTIARELYADALRPTSLFGARGVDPGASVHPEASLEDGVTVDPGAVIGAGAAIGSGTLIGANAVVGAHVQIGRDCSIGAGASVLYALIGDRVIVHPGVRIGQDGFGYVPGKHGHRKVPQVGRVIIQDDVEIGAGTTIDRGASRDTMIGEGTKIDNLVQIGHNVTIGRHCIIVGQVGLAGSVKLGDYVQLGGQVGVADHLVIGDGARVTASSGVMSDIPPGELWGWTPARPFREVFHMLSALKQLAKGAETGTDDGPAKGDDGKAR